MSYNLLMPEEEHRSLRAWWLLVWQRRWWIALATLFVLAWWLIPALLYRHTGTAKDAKLKAITDTRTALLAGLIGVGALLTFWLNSRAYRITARTFELTEQGHITERYTKAIEQLGDNELAVRLGGIYALERLAHDSERDHPTAVEVLSAFVREGTRTQGTRPPKQGVAQATADELHATEPGTNDEARPATDIEEALLAALADPWFVQRLVDQFTRARPATDIQAAVSVLGRLPQRPGISRGDLSEADLSGARLDAANLSSAQLGKVNLSGVQALDVNLSGARLDEASLRGAQLDLVNLSGARLFHADLSGARLDIVNLSDATLTVANLSGVKFTEVNLSRASLGAANLSGAFLDITNLSGAFLITANLSGAKLKETDLSGADLTQANLSDAQLGGVKLSGARLNGANMSGAKLARTVGLTQAQLDVARGDATTQLPDELHRPTSWPARGDRPVV
jgi:uncharacterized protein YjbI with pentapeptide repeats